MEQKILAVLKTEKCNCSARALVVELLSELQKAQSEVEKANKRLHHVYELFQCMTSNADLDSYEAWLKERKSKQP